MDGQGKTEPTDPFTKMFSDPTILGQAGLFLFGLGCLAAIFGFGADDVKKVVAGAVLLLFGYPMLLHAGSLKSITKLERRIGELERRIGELERTTAG